MTRPRRPRRDVGRADGPLRVVIIAPVLPYDGIAHAGGVYLQHLHRALVQSGADLTFLVHDIDANHEGLGRQGAPERSVLLGFSHRRSSLEKLAMWAAWNLDPMLVRRNPTWPPLPLITQLLFHPQARAALRAADVVDLQWPEYARLLPLVRALNPRARRVATLHDVLSQRWERRATGSSDAGLSVVRRALRSSRRLERATLRQADDVIVFSEKDRELLRDAAPNGLGHVTVVPPPLSGAESPVRRADPGSPVVISVAFWARSENEEGVLWLLREVWPKVVARMPRARLRLVGAGAGPRVFDAVAAADQVELVGFVPELDEVYATASACVVPLRQGAGVKFKTVEALLAGVPTVTTTVGAEGIGGAERFAALSDDPGELADALVEILADPVTTEAAAAVTQVWARERYSIDHFVREVGRIYRVNGRSPDLAGRRDSARPQP